MARKQSTKIRAASPARQEAQFARAVNDVAATIGLPEAQRQPHLVAIHTVEQIADEPRVTDRTLRKLTRVDRLRNSGALDAYQAEAVNLYVARAELAQGDTVKATSYGQGGSSDPTDAASAAHDRNLNRTAHIHRFHEMQASIPAPYRKAFDAVVLDNQQLGLVSERQFPGLGKSQASHNLRQLVTTCADHIANDFGHLLGERPVSHRTHLMATMDRFNRHIEATKPPADDAAPKSKTPMSDVIEAAIMAAHGSVTALLLSESVRGDLMRENCLRDLPTFCDVDVVVQPTWQFGWIVSRGQ